jgi:hypothetical protein
MRRLALGIAVLGFTSCAAFAANDCPTRDVGAYGTGGQQSGGAAQGGEFSAQGTTSGGDDYCVTGAGGALTGMLNVTGGVSGTVNGAYINQIQRGRLRGIFGDCTGFCDDE